MTRLAVQPPREKVKSAAFVPEIANGVAPKVSVPVPVQAGILVVEQLFTDIGTAIEVVEVPCLPKVSTGGCTELALLPT